MDKALRDMDTYKLKHGSNVSRKKLIKRAERIADRRYVTYTAFKNRIGLTSKPPTGRQRGCFQRAFSNFEEKQLVAWIKMRQVNQMPISLPIFQVAARVHCNRPDFKASERWWLGFKKRHPGLNSLKPEVQSASRAQAKSEPAVRQHFDIFTYSYVWVCEKNGMDVLPRGFSGNADEKPVCTRHKVGVFWCIVC